MIFKSDVENFFKLTKGPSQIGLLKVFVYFFHPRLMPIGIFRLSSFFYQVGLKPLALILSYMNQILFGLEISPKVKIGKGFFMPHCRATVIGANEIGENVTIYQNVTIGAKYLDFGYNTDTRPTIGNNVIIGTGATVLGGVKISDGVRIGPHTLVTTDLEENSRHTTSVVKNSGVNSGVITKAKPEMVTFKERGDDRGLLIVVEGIKDAPFEIKRIYYIFDTKSGVRRGYHAHRNLKQIAIAVKGSCKFLVDDGEKQSHYVLDKPNEGLLLHGFLWREMYDFSEDCVLLVLADQYYDESDYVRSYDDFTKIVNLNKAYS